MSKPHTDMMTALILAGGRSSRMGRDKAEIVIDGRTMLERTCDLGYAFAPDRLHILGRPDHPLGLADEQPFEGPARAIVGFLATLKEPARILVLPVDMPGLAESHIAALLDHLPGAYFDDLFLPFTATVEPGFTFSGTRMKELLSALGVRKLSVPAGWSAALSNINTPADLARLHRVETGDS